MKFANSQMYPSDAPAEFLERIAKKQATDLLDGVIGQIEKDKWYSIRWTDVDFGQPDPFTFTKTMQIEVEPIREKTLVHVSTEQIHLKPSIDKPLSEKLKNCWRYLRDKTGGRLEEKVRGDSDNNH